MIPTKTINLDFWRHPTDILHLVQGESDGRKIRFKITDNGATADLTGFIAIFAIKKPDGNIVVNSATITEAESGIVETTISSQVVTTAGNAHTELHLMKEGQLSKSFRIVTKVAPGVDIDGIAPSVSEFNALQTLIGQAETVISIADTELWPEVVANAQYFSDLAGANRTTETVKANADEIADVAGSGRTTQTVKGNADEITALGDRLDHSLDAPSGLVLRNLVTNGDFADGLNGWTVGASVPMPTIENGIATWQAPGSIAISHTIYQTNFNIVKNSKCYFFARAKGQAFRATAYTIIDHSLSVNSVDFMFNSAILNISENGTRFHLTAVPSGVVSVDYCGVIDLTAAFGAGNEPTKTELDLLLSILGGYIEGARSVTVGEYIKWREAWMQAQIDALVG